MSRAGVHEMPPLLVSPSWVRERLGQADLRVVDCRFVLGDPGGGHALYRESHIAGAAFLDVDRDLSDSPAAAGAGGGRHPLPSRASLEGRLRAIGVSEGTHVVAYDDALSGGAARLWWLLRHFGVTRASVLEGGFSAWRGPLAEGDEGFAPGDVALGPGRGDDVVDATDVRARLGDPSRLLLDARAPARYRGEVEPVDPVAGHVPGAVNVPFDAPAPSLDGVVDADDVELVAYCGSGITACALILRLAAAGRRDVRLYPGSWSDWVAVGGAVETSPAPPDGR